MPIYYEWTSIKKKRRRFNKCNQFEVTNHPLRLNKHGLSKSYIDTVNKWSEAFDGVDPLLRFEQMDLYEKSCMEETVIATVNYSKTWNARRAVILNKYTTGEKLTIVSSFLPGGEKTLIRQVSNLNEKVKHRLEQLDDFDESSVRKTMGLSQQEFVSKIHVLSEEIKKAWETEQRVKAFKIAIQCSKLLSDVNVMQFYPSKFVLITDILDTFGNLVYDRLKEKSYGSEAKTVRDIDSKVIPESAKETCQNWMFKMSSIRELLPRLYMEIALLKCYAFLSSEEIEPAIVRLTVMIRGIGNPLVAVYLRMYLCRVAADLLSQRVEDHFYNNLKEFIDEYQQIFSPMIRKKYETQLLTLDKYLNLYIPAVQDWLLYGTLNSNRCKLTLFDELLQQCINMENNELLLCCLVSAFDSPTIIKRASKILEIVQTSADKMVLVHEVLTSLGEHLCSAADGFPGSEDFVKTWWKIASNIKSMSNFLQVLAPWLQFSCSHLSTQHINMILRGTIRYMIKSGQPADEYAGILQLVIKRMLKAIPEVEELFLMDAFMPVVELSQTSNARTMMAKTVLSMFFSRYNSLYIDDHVIISCLMRLCRILHDSINAVTLEDESKVCAELIVKYIQQVTYHEDTEQQLNFYVDCRSAFIKLDAVLIALVHAVNTLSAGCRGRWVQRACAAYSFVTVPSLGCALTKAQLYLLNGQVALLNNCIGQAEANFKAFVGLIPDIPEYIVEDGQKKSTHVKVGGMTSNFLSTLLILPDNVDSHTKAYILSGFIRIMEKIHWKKTDSLYYTTLLRTLDLLCEMTQETYVYNIETVLSNDKLYGGEIEFVQCIEKYSTNVCQELLVILKSLGDSNETKKQYNLAMELFWRVVRRGDLEDASMMSLAANLWLLSQKIQDSNNRMAKAIISALEKDDNPTSQRLVQKISESAKC